MSDLTVGQVLGGYRLDEFAGRGGMGVVYRATQVRLERVVALKVIAPELASDPAFRERFQREARLLASVDDPNVVAVYEADEAEGQLFLSMRWIDGGDLAGEIARTGGLELMRAQRLLAQVASGLDAVHAHGLVHGDLKPANMLIEQRRDGDERAFVSDFGAGRSLTASTSGTWLGTVDYVAPETIRGAPPDAQSDLYGLACVLFEALTGAPPFHRDTAWATMWAHYSDPVPSASERRPALPRAVDAVLARGLAKDPEHRYPTAQRLIEALADVLLTARGQPTGPLLATHRQSAQTPAPTPAPGPNSDHQAAPLTAPARPVAAARRRRRPLALAGLALAACAIAAGVITLALSGTSHPGTITHHVYHVANTGGLTLNVRSAPRLSASVTSRRPAGTTIAIACQTTGDEVNGVSNIWDQLTSGGYISDYYVNTPVVGAPSPGIPSCSVPASRPPPRHLSHPPPSSTG